MAISKQLANRIGFIILGLTNNFAYVIMLSAAYDLLNQSSATLQSDQHNQTKSPSSSPSQDAFITIDTSYEPNIGTTNNPSIGNQTIVKEKYCNEHSTSTILIADTLPSLATKIFYPFILVGLPTPYKATATAILSAAAFIITGLSTDQILIFTGVVCASFSSGLGESTYISNTHLYGDVSLSGWSIGTGGAGLLGAIAYATLRIFLSIKVIMYIMLIIPIAMIYAFFFIIKPVIDPQWTDISDNTASNSQQMPKQPVGVSTTDVYTISPGVQELDEQEQPIKDNKPVRNYGSREAIDRLGTQLVGATTTTTTSDETGVCAPFNFRTKLRCLPSLAKYFLPLLLVYFAEYFINQGLFELIYYPEITFLDHGAQYRWFQVSYQLGVMISRSSLDFLQIRNIWSMSLLQAANAVLFFAHASKIIHIPSFYIVIALIIYEGLLGGFTYVNTFYRIKKEVSKERQEFCMSTVTIADSLGIVMAGAVALPVHDALCKLYE